MKDQVLTNAEIEIVRWLIGEVKDRLEELQKDVDMENPYQPDLSESLIQVKNALKILGSKDQS